MPPPSQVAIRSSGMMTVMSCRHTQTDKKPAGDVAPDFGGGKAQPCPYLLTDSVMAVVFLVRTVYTVTAPVDRATAIDCNRSGILGPVQDIFEKPGGDGCYKGCDRPHHRHDRIQQGIGHEDRIDTRFRRGNQKGSRRPLVGPLFLQCCCRRQHTTRSERQGYPEKGCLEHR